MRRALVTGANGFVGRAACEALLAAGWRVRAAVRESGAAAAVPGACETHVVGDIAASPDWAPALAGVDAVLHLASRVHVMRDVGDDGAAAYRRVNVDATRRLAEAAIAAGTRRLVYVSSVKAVAERSAAPLDESTRGAPEDAYGRSKREAELLLTTLAASSALEVAILRPPLVYGPGVGGNFRRLLALVRLGARVPLPLANGGRRSLVYVGNLASALVAALEHPAAPGQTFFVRDGEDLSTGDLLRVLGAALGLRPRLFPVPRGLVRLAARAVGRARDVDRLVGDLQIDDAHLRRTLGWRPPVAATEALTLTARALAAADRRPPTPLS